MLCDSHAHLDDAKYDNDRDDVIRELYQGGVSLVINIGSDMENSRKSVALANQYDFIYATVGVHPYYTVDDNDLAELEQLAQNKKVVAIGEIGLDYHGDYLPKDVQKATFRAQSELAKRLDMPIVVHDRDAHDDCIEMVRDIGSRGIFHCFSGDADMARKIVDMGFYVSFAGNVTYKKAQNLVEAAAVVPMDRLLIETDSPYLAPTGHRGKRNTPLYVELIARHIAQIKGVTFEEIAEATMANAKEVFGI